MGERRAEWDANEDAVKGAAGRRAASGGPTSDHSLTLVATDTASDYVKKPRAVSPGLWGNSLVTSAATRTDDVSEAR